MWLFRLRRMFRVAGRDALILFFAIRDPRTPRSLKLAATAALAWIISPVDPLPDLPLIGWVDDMLVLSVALPALLRRLPPAVRDDAQARAARFIASWWPGRETSGASIDGQPAEVLEAPEPRKRSRPMASAARKPKAGATRPRAAKAGAAPSASRPRTRRATEG